MEIDQAQCLLLQAGEEVCCTNCEQALAVAVVDVIRPGVTFFEGCRVTPIGRREGLRLFCSSCGGEHGAAPGDEDVPLLKHPAPRLLIRSGSWIGWRELGGE